MVPFVTCLLWAVDVCHPSSTIAPKASILGGWFLVILALLLYETFTLILIADFFPGKSVIDQYIKNKRTRHECPCRIENSYPSMWNLTRDSDQEGEISISYITPGRQQSKTLSTINKCVSKTDRNSVLDCHLSTVGDKWQSKTLFLLIFDLRSSIVLAFSIAAYPVCTWTGS